MAGALLAAAQQYAPDNAEMLRWRIENARQAGDNAAITDLTRRLLDLDPNDTVAQLRYLSQRLQRIQTVEGRLAASDRLWQNEAVDGAVRSQVALDAALLAREVGDDIGFEQRLQTSVQLDATNRTAADLMLSYLGPKLDNPASRFELLLHVLYADPIDPETHRTIALALIESGAFAEARLFYNYALQLQAIRLGSRPPDMMGESMIVDWYAEGVQPVIERMNAQLEAERAGAKAVWDAAIADGQPTIGLTNPDEVFLQFAFERERLVGCLLIGDVEAAQRSADDIIAQLQLIARNMQKPENRRPGVTSDDIAKSLAGIAGSVWGFLAWTVATPAMISQEIEILTAIVGPESPDVRRLRGFLHLKQAEPEPALAIFEELVPQTGNLLDDLGRALALEALGRVDESKAMLKTVFRDGPLTGVGAWARQHLIAQGEPDPIDTTNLGDVQSLVRTVPRWFGQMIERPETAMHLSLDVVDISPDALDPPRLIVTLRNTSPMPLALGAEKYLSSLIAISPKVNVGVRQEIDLAQPETLNLARRLRLMPSEAVRITVDAGAASTGWVIDSGLTRTVRARWRALQDFTIGARGYLVSGPYGLEATSPGVQWPPSPEAAQSSEELASRIATGDGVALAQVAAVMRARAIESTRSEGDPWTAEDYQRLAAAAAARYPDLDARDRAMLLAIIPHARMFPPYEAFDAAAREETDADLAAIVAVTRVSDATDEFLSRWIDADQQPAAAVCEIVRERLGREDPGGYASAGPGITGLFRPVRAGAGR